MIRNYSDKIIAYRYSKYLDSAFHYFRLALPLARRNNDSLSLFRLHKWMGDAYEHHQHLDSTLSYYARCDKLIPTHDKKLKAFLLGDKAYTYRLLYDYDKSADLSLEAFALAEQSGDARQIANAAMNVADDFAFLKLFPEASQYYKKAIEIAVAAQDERMMSYAYRYYGRYLMDTKEWKEGYANLKRAERLSAQFGDSISLAYTWYHLTSYYWAEKKTDSCFYYGEKAEKIWEVRAENIDLSAVCRQIGEYYLKLGKIKEAEYYLKKSERFVLGDIYFNETLYSSLADLFFRKGDLKKAYEYLNKAKTLASEIKERELNGKLAGLRLKYEADQKETLLREEQQKSQRSQLEADRKTYERNIVILILLLAVVVAIMLTVLYLKIRNKNLELATANTALQRSTEQKQILLREIHHRVKNNLTTLKSLFFLQAKSSDKVEVKAALEECQRRVQSMALIHQNMYLEGEHEKIDFLHFLKQLFAELEISCQPPGKDIQIFLEGNDVELDMSTALFLGLIVNELATNSFKYAFEGKTQGEIRLLLSRESKSLVLLFSDNGIGLPEGFDVTRGGFGFKLLHIITQQIHASIGFTQHHHTSEFKIEIPC